MAVRGITNLDSLIAEAREMQANGSYINGTVFHAMADEIDRLRDSLKRVLSHNQAMFASAHNIAEEVSIGLGL